MKFWKHLKTITRHRMLVLAGCFRVGLYWQGLVHDLSKYSPTEFLVGVRYYQGYRSPNAAERAEKGYSESWMHHKGRNRHHYEYWSDMDMQTRTYVPVRMPRKYLAEQIMDRRAACMVYQGDAYTDASPYEYFITSREQALMHPENRRELEFLLSMLAKEGEKKTFAYIKNHVLKGKPYPWETDAGEA